MEELIDAENANFIVQAKQYFWLTDLRLDRNFTLGNGDILSATRVFRNADGDIVIHTCDGRALEIDGRNADKINVLKCKFVKSI